MGGGSASRGVCLEGSASGGSAWGVCIQGGLPGWGLGRPPSPCEQNDTQV